MDSSSESQPLIVNESAGRPPLKGLTMFTAAVFIIGEMSGTGILSLPKAVLNSGWAGLAMILACCVLSAYCGIRLSSCWMMILEQKEELGENSRDPYLVIAQEAAGKVGKYTIMLVSYIQLFGVAVIFLLIAAHNFDYLLKSYLTMLYSCDWAIIIAVCMAPVAMFGTPKDFWPIAVGAMLFTGLACLLIFVETLREETSPLPEPGPITFKSFFLSFGTILFCFGGAVMFPTIQTDMQKPGQFTKSVIVSYAVMILFYLPVCIGAFVVYGQAIQDNITDNLQPNWIKTTIIILITGHLLTAFNIILNPVYQGAESFFNAPTTFSWQRVVIRVTVLACVLFVAESIPNFGPILSFIGGTTVSLSSFILPCVFYVLLCRKAEYNREISALELALLGLCIIVSFLGGIATTYSSIQDLVDPKTFVPPCYFNRTQ